MNVESLTKKLKSEEEWLQNFEETVEKSRTIRDNVESLVNQFEQQLQTLEDNVLPMHEKNGKLQLKQHNILRLIKTIDATKQFYDRTNTVENFIRDKDPGHDLSLYLENMDCLEQAIQFFSNQNARFQTQTENMKITLENGFAMLEKEYRNILLKQTAQPDIPTLIDSLDDDTYELMASRMKDVVTVKDPTNLIKLGVWLLDKDRNRFLNYYSEIRGQNMMKTIHAVAQHYTNLVMQSTPKASAFRNTPKKSKAGGEEKIHPSGVNHIEGALLVCGALLALLEIEENLMQRAITSTASRAQVFRSLVSRPLAFAIEQCVRAVQDNEQGVIPLLPLLRFLSNHEARFQNLASNSIPEVNFESLLRSLRVKCSTYLHEYLEQIANDTSKYIPPDGGVHPLIANTLSFLCSLVSFRLTVTHQVLSLTAASTDNPSLLLPKLFARFLSALGQALKRKCELYDDIVLSNIFLLNNYNHIAKVLEEEDGLLPVLSEQNRQILSFYHSEINQSIDRYLKAWSVAVGSLHGVDYYAGNPQQIHNMLTSFIREIEDTKAQQTEYCINDPKLAGEVRQQVADTVCPPYARAVSIARAIDPGIVADLPYENETALRDSLQSLFGSSI
ncbi:hypothetical protein WR25_20770 [Diploscapter pachys]|uniref:Exocyst complex component 7 n=1 Tax=Diploscapter pachys TaxID=2018661 RepID=A0A2A2KDM3_9BILA|nr:hypothetical protein WR25_20770 [Diploscapter pachys]